MMKEIIEALKVKDVWVRFFDMKVTAGFPVPLDNDESSQTINLLDMLCPYPESCYLIKVQGDSMFDAGIRSGDIVIVDKSRRTPSEAEVAVCELNGDYTLKHFVMRGDRAFLVPANPAYSEIELTECDDFSVWGTVTFIIKKCTH